ncbi:hypothetical protein [Rhizobium favelukesii]|uniref:Toprim domain-containing protein n=3 Tax=Rhizobium/Agrobacterium group TaxID=227290 RepID=W6RDW4_9HYPH|nr:hypothetical protein LPU83_3399 [Rhizobium favelukesii]
MAMIEAGLHHVVSLPNGAPSGPETSEKRYEPFGTHWELLLEVKRFLIATDMDGPGEGRARSILVSDGVWTAHGYSVPAGLGSWTKVLKAPEPKSLIDRTQVQCSEATPMVSIFEA